jgi:hypothetical protein
MCRCAHSSAHLNEVVDALCNTWGRCRRPVMFMHASNLAVHATHLCCCCCIPTIVWLAVRRYQRGAAVVTALVTTVCWLHPIPLCAAHWKPPAASTMTFSGSACQTTTSQSQRSSPLMQAAALAPRCVAVSQPTVSLSYDMRM